jgi:hypothetical protein
MLPAASSGEHLLKITPEFGKTIHPKIWSRSGILLSTYCDRTHLLKLGLKPNASKPDEIVIIWHIFSRLLEYALALGTFKASGFLI